MSIKQNQVSVKSKSEMTIHPLRDVKRVRNAYNAVIVKKGVAAMFNQSLSVSNSMKLIRFFRIVSVFGAVVMVARILIFIRGHQPQC